MTLLDTRERYGSIHMLFHWVMALGIISLLIVGFVMTNIDRNPTLYILHKASGVLIFALAVLRVLWVSFNIKLNRRVEADPKINKILVRLAKLGHAALYLFMFLMPISGMMMSLFYGIKVSVFGLFTIPAFTPDYQIGAFFKYVHHTSGLFLAITLLIHFLMALMHHYLFKDNTLKKMLPLN